ncbi:ABC transporter substrate-binding protein [Janthinobacterium sp. 17J80-10]|uniref:ABC transporter substrate-binding protein n=1 Tax=Janthinobacterium sp. 17J80-10 TaxID=2497863 RepID=UPI0013E8ACF4|nr:ABC transporter substrate-binding protein [Janthinobacterium sp. 17J80-10]
MDPRKRQTLERLAALAAGALSIPGVAQAQGLALPKAVRLAGGASYANGRLRLGGLAHFIAEQGWLEQQLNQRGSKLEWFGTSHAAVGPMINEAFTNGSVDFASYGDLPSAILNAGGVDTRLLVPNGLGQGDAFLVVPRESKARSIEDLKGKSLAVHRGRPWELPLVRLLQAKGLKYSDFKLYNINPQTGMSALASKHVDALFTMTDAYLLEDKGVGRIIWSTKEAPLDWKTRTELWGSKAFIDKYPDLTQLVVTAYIKAAHWASQEANQDAVFALATANGTPESVVRRSYADRKYPWKERYTPLFNEVVYEHYRNTIAFAYDQKIIQRKIDLDTWFDKRFVPVALKDLGIENYWKPVTSTHGTERATQKSKLAAHR